MPMNVQMTMLNIMEREMNYTEARLVNEKYDQEHGSFWDRGSADSYYHRPRNPHRGGVGGDSGLRIEAVTEAEFEAYHAGYDFNEEFGGKKSYE